MIVNLIKESLGALNEEALSIKQVVLQRYTIHKKMAMKMDIKKNKCKEDPPC